MPELFSSSDDLSKIAVPISLTSRLEDSCPFDAKSIPWPGFTRMMKNFSKMSFEEKKSAPLWSPTIFSTGYRSHETATQSGMAVQDSDHGVTMHEMVETFQEWQLEALIHSSSRNRPCEPRWRLIVPFAALVDRFEHAAASEAISRVLANRFGDRWVLDTSKGHCGDLYYVPGRYKWAKANDGTEFAPDNQFEHIVGQVITAADWIEIADQVAPKPTVEKAEAIDFTLRNDVNWTLPADILDRYLSLSDGRNVGRYGFAVSAAMSAINAGYDIGEAELFSLVEGAQRRSPGTRPHSRRGLQRLVRDALDDARRNTPDPAFARRSSWQFEYPRSPDTSLTWWERDLCAEVEVEATSSAQNVREPFARLGRNAFDLINRVIPPRQWMLAQAYCKGFLSSTIGEGAAGKTTTLVARSVALASGREITGEHIFTRCKVLYLTLEDDVEELARRVQAACRYHRIDYLDVDGWLYLDAITNGCKLTKTDHDGNRTTGDLKDKLSEAVDRLGIDLVIVDPFVKSHGAVSENDNAAIDAAVSVLTDLCVTKNIAIDAPHHIRKGGAGLAGSAETARGGSAFRDAIRLGYTLTRMTEDDAKRYGLPVESRWQYVRFDTAKVNIAVGGTTTWFRLVGVPLENATELYPEGDTIQVAEPWSPPDLLLVIEDESFRDFVLDEIRRAPRDNLYSGAYNAGNDRHISKVMREAKPELTREQCQTILDRWLSDRIVIKTEYKDAGSRKKTGLIVNEKPASDPATVFH